MWIHQGQGLNYIHLLISSIQHNVYIKKKHVFHKHLWNQADELTLGTSKTFITSMTQKHTYFYADLFLLSWFLFSISSWQLISWLGFLTRTFTWVRISALHFLNTHFQPGHTGGTKMCLFFYDLLSSNLAYKTLYYLQWQSCQSMPSLPKRKRAKVKNHAEAGITFWHLICPFLATSHFSASISLVVNFFSP